MSNNNLLPKKFNDQQKGILLIIVGSILLMYTLNLFAYSNYIIAFIGLGLIAYGVVQTDLHTRILRLFNK